MNLNVQAETYTSRRKHVRKILVIKIRQRFLKQDIKSINYLKMEKLNVILHITKYYFSLVF